LKEHKFGVVKNLDVLDKKIIFFYQDQFNFHRRGLRKKLHRSK